MVVVRHQPGLEKRLERMARKTGQTSVSIAIEAIGKYLPEFEQRKEIVSRKSRRR